MLIVRFDKAADADTGMVVCAAFNLDKLNDGNIVFAQNSYRGDHYAPAMDALIRAKGAQ